MHRRDFLKGLAATLMVYQQPLLASSPPMAQQKVVWIMLRGAMDALHTVIPTFEPTLATLRPSLYQSIAQTWLPLEQPAGLQQGYALHPSLSHLHHYYKQRQLLPIVATSSGYAKRSHFEAQDHLESGLASADAENGWLARAVQYKNKQAIAIAQSTPISLRGAKTNTNTWYPSRLPDAEQSTYEALNQLYQHSPKLRSRLQEGLQMKAMLTPQSMTQKKQGNFVNLSRDCATLLSQQRIDCAMLTLDGWDTHKSQSGRLARQLSLLDNGIAALQQGLGTQWQNTLVIVASEFGRTVKENGTGGTDHGTASALFLAGGNINGGQVLGEWPGLAPYQLHQQRDLKATSQYFDWIAAALQQHWQIPSAQLRRIFPTAQPYTGSIMRDT